MSTRKLYLRIGKYLQRHGLKTTMKRLWREARNDLFYNRDIIYWRDLILEEFEGHVVPESCRVERYEKSSGIPARLYNRIAEEYSEELLKGYINRRFDKGAYLWCLRNDAEDMSYTWSLTGQAMNHYYFPLMEHDLYFFDGYTFPPFRGRALNSVLLDYVMEYYKNKGFQRAYLETKEWNKSVIKLMPKSGFTRIGLARKRIRRGKCKVTWWY